MKYFPLKLINYFPNAFPRSKIHEEREDNDVFVAIHQSIVSIELIHTLNHEYQVIVGIVTVTTN